MEQQQADIVTIDRQGRWWYEGRQIIHPDVLALFKQSLEKDAQTGDLCIHYRGQTLPVEVESCPFFIRDIRVERDAEGILQAVTLVLDDDTEEVLDPDTLRLNGHGVLEAAVKKGEFTACCLPTAHFRLAGLFEESSGGGFKLRIAGKSYPVHQSPA